MADTIFDARPPSPSPRRGLPERIKLLAGVAAAFVVTGLCFLLFGSSSPNLNPIAQAATLSSNAPGYKIRMSIQMTSSALSAPITGTGSGIVDVRDGASSMSFEMNLGNDPQVMQALGGSTIRMNMILEGGAVYVKLPAALMARLPIVSKAWIKVDLAKLANLPGLSALESNPGANDPSQFLHELQAASSNVVNLGPEFVDGTETTHYRAALSLNQLASFMPSAEQQQVEKALSMFEQASSTHDFQIDAWVDAQHLVRRMAVTIDLAVGTGPSISETVTVDISDYGPQLKPAAPPAGEVQDLTGLAGTSGA
jgi:hypothetical protein